MRTFTLAMAKRSIVYLDIAGPDWEPLRAYAKSQGLTDTQAARELLMTSMSINLTNGVYIANARTIRHQMLRLGLKAMMNGANQMIEELRAQLIAAGVPTDEIQGI